MWHSKYGVWRGWIDQPTWVPADSQLKPVTGPIQAGDQTVQPGRGPAAGPDEARGSELGRGPRVRARTRPRGQSPDEAPWSGEPSRSWRRSNTTSGTSDLTSPPYRQISLTRLDRRKLYPGLAGMNRVS